MPPLLKNRREIRPIRRAEFDGYVPSRSRDTYRNSHRRNFAVSPEKVRLGSARCVRRYALGFRLPAVFGRVQWHERASVATCRRNVRKARPTS